MPQALTTPQLAIFDFDGTIALKSKVAASVVEACRQLRQKDCITTISTGRGYLRIKDALAEDFEQVIAPNALIMLEHGTKIVKRDGTMVFGETFGPEEVDHVIDFVRANSDLCKFILLEPNDNNQKVQVGCFDERDVQAIREERSHYADVFTISFGQLNDLLAKHQFTSLSVRLKPHIKVQNLKLAFTRSSTNVLFLDEYMTFVKNNTNKGLAALYVAKKLHISTDHMLLAGNAINDVEMLDIGAGATVLVSPPNDRAQILSYLSAPETVTSVATPSDLGDYLLTL